MIYPHPYKRLERIAADDEITVSARFATEIGQIHNCDPLSLWRVGDSDLIEVEMRVEDSRFGRTAHTIWTPEGRMIASCFKERVKFRVSADDNTYQVVTVLHPRFYESWNDHRGRIQLTHKGEDSFYTLMGGPLPNLRQQAVELYESTKEAQHG